MPGGKSFNAELKASDPTVTSPATFLPGILTDDRRDDLVPSLFEEFLAAGGRDGRRGRHGELRKKRRFEALPEEMG